MNLSPDALLASFLISTVGFGLFLYGKRATRLPQLVAGLALMILPALVSSPGWMLAGTGLVLVLLVGWARASA